MRVKWIECERENTKKICRLFTAAVKKKSFSISIAFAFHGRESTKKKNRTPVFHVCHSLSFGFPVLAFGFFSPSRTILFTSNVIWWLDFIYRICDFFYSYYFICFFSSFSLSLSLYCCYGLHVDGGCKLVVVPVHCVHCGWGRHDFFPPNFGLFHVSPSKKYV